MWNKHAAHERRGAESRPDWAPGWNGWPTSFAGRPGFWPVFCASLADVFDNEVPQAWREDLWNLIAATQNLSWLLLTKRIGNVARMVPPEWIAAFPSNVRLMISVVNQEEVGRDVPKLLALNCRNGISYEPALGPVDWYEALGIWWNSTEQKVVKEPGRHVEWIICGGESGPKARPFNMEWAQRTVLQCKDADIPVFVKQMGSNSVWGAEPYKWKDRAGSDSAEWPESFRVQQFPLAV